MASTSIKVTGNVTEALAALERLGIKAEDTAKKTESSLVGAAQRTGGVFTHLGQTLASWGVPFTSSLDKIGAKFNETEGKGKNFGAALAEVGKAVTVGAAGGLAVVAGESLKLGMNFEESTTKLVTGAGESEDAIGKVRKGILAMAGQVGQMPEQLSQGMYLIESAGYHAADGLTVLKAAAQGAKVGGADMATVANAVTTTLTDYGKKASDASTVTSQLVATVASGKTTMQDLGNSLSAVLPSASKAGIGLEQVLGAMGTMTGQGISAQQAAQNLNSTIANLQKPSDVASKAMAQMGLNSTTVAQQLGQKGLTGTLGELSKSIMDHMGKDGLVLENSFNQSALAAQSAQEMLAKLPPSLQGLGKEFLNNQITQKQWMAALKGQDVLTANLGREFATTAKTANGFSDTLKTGQGAAKTFNALMSDMTGGQSGLDTALALTGSNMSTFQANVKAIGSTTADAKGNVQGFALSQKDLKAKLDDAKAGLTALGTQFGMWLIPKVTEAIAKVQEIVSWFKQHKAVAKDLAEVIGGILAATVAAFAINTMAKLVKSFIDAGKNVVKFIGKLGDLAGKLIDVGGKVATFVADFAKQTAQLIVRGAEWVAAHAVQTATIIAQNVAQAASATAAFIAENAATLGIIAGIALLIAAVVLLVTHWRQVWGFIKEIALDVWHFLVDVWHQIEATTVSVWNSIMGFLKKWWPEILGVFTGGLGLIVGLVIQHWSQISQFTANLWHEVTGFISNMWHDVTGFFTRMFGDVVNAVSTGIGDVVTWFEGLPGKIQDALAGLLDDMLHFGENIVHNIVQGIENSAGDIAGAIGGIMNKIPGVGLLKSAGGLVSKILGDGGPVAPNNLYIVGDRGPELFVPDGSGTIIPNHQMGSYLDNAATKQSALPSASPVPGGSTTVINNNVTAMTSADPHSIASEIAWQLRPYLGG